jgi:hypothetical protein
MRGLHESGFAAEQVGASGIVMNDIHVIPKQWPFAVKQEPVGAGMIPSIVIRMRYTDRGLLTQASLDKNVHQFLKNNGFVVSRATSFKPVQVTWKWMHDKQADFYYPVIATPGELAGLRYSGNAVTLPVYSADPKVIAKLPSEIYVYTMAATRALLHGIPGRGFVGSMTDGDAAQVLTLVRQAMMGMASAQGYAHVLFTTRGCPEEVFIDPKPIDPVVVGFSSLLLIVAYNMVSTHIGSERL